MSIAALERTRAAWIADEDSAVLERIHDRHVQLALWQLRRARALDWLDDLDFDEIDDVQKTLKVESLAFCLPGVLLEAGYPDGPCVFRKVPDSDSGKSRTVISESPGQAFR